MIENQRIEALEETVETVLRPLVDLLPAERVNSIELTGYDAQLRVATLEARVAVLEQRTAEALQTANAVVNSRIWQSPGKGERSTAAPYAASRDQDL